MISKLPTLATIIAALLLPAQDSFQFNVTYTCNGERVVITRCRDESPDAYCSVSYPDRRGPTTGGTTPVYAEKRRDILRKLQACQALSAAPAGPPPAQPGTFEAKVESYLRQSGYEFHKVKTNSWYLIASGKEMGQIRIILGAGPSSIAMGAVVVPKRNLRIDADAMYKLMKLSYDLNYVRVCIDSDDDLIVMSQVKDPWLNVEEFKTTINYVATAADRTYGVMRPFLN